MTRAVLALALSIALPGAAFAQSSQDVPAAQSAQQAPAAQSSQQAPAAQSAPSGPIAPPLGTWSTDLLDPAGLTRFHLITRASFSDGKSTLADRSAWSYEARAYVRVVDGFAITGVVPIGLSPSFQETSSKLFLGNVGLGATLGGDLISRPGLRLSLGGGLDVYLPTQAEAGDPTTALMEGTVAGIRAYEPQLYVPRMLSFRARAAAQATISLLAVELEGGLIPGWTFTQDKTSQLLLAVAARASADLSFVEPYVELAVARQVSGDGDIAPPLALTPGVRFHIADVFDPALFVTFNFEVTPAVIFGLDLGAVVRPSIAEERAVKRQEATDHFMDF